ncbi:acyltransferase [Actinocrinis sp.]|uniref:acyltransferase family protein n=1 Tax=Actinocrinis sp. TaxID=1920516 RepID=UPI002BD6F50F|nr:acyltransferase [Actinocrinis sp.]HXR70961.1 acyltransferase [Actinocrinis sp.]
MPTVATRGLKPRLDSLTGLRFVAAALVFFFHGSIEFVFANPSTQSGYLTAARTAGFVGVSFFFILSGFVLTWSSRPQDRARSFWRRRFFKIAPNYLVTYVAALILLASIHKPSGIGQAVANLFFVQSWVPQFSYMSGVNDVSWTLSAEAFFYLSFPLLLVLIKRIKETQLWYWAAGVVAAVFVLPAVAQAAFADKPYFIWGPASWHQIWFVYTFPAARLLEFTLGILLARIVLAGKWIPQFGVLPATVIAVAGYVLSLHAPFLYRYAAATVIPLALLIPAAATADAAGRRTVFSSRVMIRLGEVSFAFYLVHHLVIVYGHRAFGLGAYGYPKAWSTLPAIAFLIGTFVVSLILAWGLYELVERPVMRRWSAARPKAGSVGPIPAQAPVPQTEQVAPGRLAPTANAE